MFKLKHLRSISSQTPKTSSQF